MIYDIKTFIDIYAGTAIGQEVKNMLDNADEDDFDQIESIYQRVVDF